MYRRYIHRGLIHEPQLDHGLFVKLLLCRVMWEIRWPDMFGHRIFTHQLPRGADSHENFPVVDPLFF